MPRIRYTVRHLAASFTVFALCLLTAACSRESGTAPGAGTDDGAAAGPHVGLLMETYDVARWARDEEYFTQEVERLGGRVTRAVANGDQDKQNQQADTFLTQGVDVLVVVPKNLKTAARIVKSAHEKGVPVLAYDRLIRNCDLDLYITFDNEHVGYLQAKGVLENVPEGNYILMGGAGSDNNAQLLRRGQLQAIAEHEAETGRVISILDDRFLNNWDSEEARQRISNLLTKFRAEGRTVDAIVASNDGTAGGAVAALKAEGLDGKVAVSGQDAELAACRRVVQGTQTVTVYKPVRLLAQVAAAAAVGLSRGQTAEEVIAELGHEVNRLDNGSTEVPSVFLEPVFVTRENMRETVVADGWHGEDKVYGQAE
jgi:D-xylose transport system substrate-binding protein